MHRLDELRLLRVIAQGLADEADRLGERGLADVRILPRNVHQRLLRDDTAGAFDQVLEDGQRTRRQAHFFAVAREQAVGEVEPEPPEVDD